MLIGGEIQFRGRGWCFDVSVRCEISLPPNRRSSDMNKLPLAAAWTRGTRDPIRDDMVEMLKVHLSRYAREA